MRSQEYYDEGNDAIDPYANYYDPNTGLTQKTYAEEPVSATYSDPAGGTGSGTNYGIDISKPTTTGWTDYGDDISYATGISQTESQPWSEQINYLKSLFSEAQNLYNKTMSYYPEGWTAADAVASFAPEQQTAQGMVSSRALQGSPLLSAGQQSLQDTLSGNYLSPDTNSYLNYYVQQALENVMPKLDSSAIQSGRYGSGAWGLMKGRTAADVANEIYGQAYKDERQNMIDALKYGIGYSREDYYDPAMLAAVGEEKQSYDQSLIDAALTEHQFNQYADWWKLGQYKDMISGDYGGSSTSTYPVVTTSGSSESSYGDTSWLDDLISQYFGSSSNSDNSDNSDDSSSSSSSDNEGWWSGILDDFGDLY